MATDAVQTSEAPSATHANESETNTNEEISEDENLDYNTFAALSSEQILYGMDERLIAPVVDNIEGIHLYSENEGSMIIDLTVDGKDIEETISVFEQELGISFDDDNQGNIPDTNFSLYIHHMNDLLIVRYVGSDFGITQPKDYFDALPPDALPKISESTDADFYDMFFDLEGAIVLNVTYSFNSGSSEEIIIDFVDKLSGYDNFVSEDNNHYVDAEIDSNLKIESTIEDNSIIEMITLTNKNIVNSNGYETDDSYYSKAHAFIEETLFRNLISIYLEPVLEHITSFEYYYDLQDGEVLRVYSDISATEMVFLLGNSDMDVQVSESGFEEITLTYPNAEGTVVFKEDSIFFEGFDLSCLKSGEIFTVFPEELFPKIAEEQGELAGIDIALYEDGTINILRQIHYNGSDQQYLIQNYKNEVAAEYANNHHKLDGNDVYECSLSKGGELRIEMNSYMICTGVILSSPSSATNLLDEGEIDNFMITDTSQKLFYLLKDYIYDIQISIADGEEMRFLNDNGEFYMADKDESLLYMFMFDNNIDLDKLTDEISNAFPDFITRSEENGAEQWWAFEENQVFCLFKQFEYEYACACITLNDYTVTEDCELFECENNAEMKDFLSVPSEFKNIESRSIDIKIETYNDGGIIVNYYNELFVNDLSYSEVISILENHFTENMGEYEKISEGRYTTLMSAENESTIYIDDNNDYVRVYIGLIR
jgi:hypothetical protein